MTDPNLIDQNWEEHYVKRGDPNKPTYYIIRSKLHVGLFVCFNSVAAHIRYALPKGWLPVVDMQNYPNYYLQPEKLGKENAWEYYFEQPLRIGLEQAYNGENIVLSGASLPNPLMNAIKLCANKSFYMEWKMLVTLGLLRIKDELRREILDIQKKLFSVNDRVLGVLLRGTDYIAKRPHGHPIPPPHRISFENGIC